MSVTKIEKLLENLPKKDIQLAKDLLSLRLFEDLYSIIKSDIIIVEREQAKENPKEQYKDIDIDKLQELRVEVKDYYSKITDFEDTEEYD